MDKQQDSITIRTFQILGITSSTFIAGTLFGASHLTIPSILFLPANSLLPAWNTLYARGYAFVPPVAILGSINYGVVSNYYYNNNARSNPSSWRWKIYALASVTTLSLIPFTLIAMGDVNATLLKAANAVATGTGEVLTQDGAQMAVERWGYLNMQRSLLPFIGGLLGLYGAL